MANNFPRPRTIKEDGLKRWLEKRNVDYDLFVVLVGPNPDKPRVSKRRLSVDLKPGHVFAEATITRWIEQLKREIQQ